MEMPTSVNGYPLIAACMTATPEVQYVIMVRTGRIEKSKGEYCIALWDGDNPTWRNGRYVRGYADAWERFAERVDVYNNNAEFGPPYQSMTPVRDSHEAILQNVPTMDSLPDDFGTDDDN